MSGAGVRSQESEVRREDREFVRCGQAERDADIVRQAEEQARPKVMNLVASELLPLCHYEGVSLDAAGAVAASVVDSLFRNFVVTER